MATKSTPRPLPGREQLPREFIVQHQRARIIAALSAEIAEKGYRNVTVAAIVKRARIARGTFYESFGSKDECFLAAQEYAMATALERVVEAAGELEGWPQRVRAGLTAFLEYVSEEPALASACMAEALAAGPAALKCHEESQQAFISLFKVGRSVSPYEKDLPDTLEEAVIGGIFWIVYQRLVKGSMEEIPGLLPEIVEFSLVPYLGPEAAREFALGAAESVR